MTRTLRSGEVLIFEEKVKQTWISNEVIAIFTGNAFLTMPCVANFNEGAKIYAIDTEETITIPIQNKYGSSIVFKTKTFNGFKEF
jgi:hypothetical protein